MMRQLPAFVLILMLLGPAPSAHDGPPYPIVSNQTLGRFRVSVWTDPDTTDDGSRGGQFWVMVDPARPGERVPPGLRARVSIRPLDRAGDAIAGDAAPVDGDAARQFVALLMDHEGRFAVHVDIHDGGSSSSVDAEVQATYDARPASGLLVLYALPFVFVGFLWAKLLVRRRQARRPR